MRPPLVSDELIRNVIGEVAASGSRVTGVAVRAALARRHGVRGGVARIYRLVRDSQQPARAAATRPPVPLSAETRDAAIERANLAEHREQVHQMRWARETDALRARLADADAVLRELADARQRIHDLTRALASAQAHIASLEARPSAP